MTRALVTGAGGFVGSHVLEYLIAHTGWDLVATDSFRHKGKTDRISQIICGYQNRVQVVTHDLCAPVSTQLAHQIGPVDHVVAVASESHVPRSIVDPVRFTQNNVNIALTTLEYCREVNPQSIIWISTDEVYGPQGPSGPHKEWAPILSSSPYAASKAAQEAIAIAYWRTYGLPVAIVNCANLIGERQDHEKFLPMCIRNILMGSTVKVHGTAAEVGSRYYLPAQDLADALLWIMTMNGPVSTFSPQMADPRPDRYNVIGPDCISNLELAEKIAVIIGQPLHYQVVPFERPGHDMHYGLDGAKLAAAGWKPFLKFDEALERIVTWFLAHRDWLDG